MCCLPASLFGRQEGGTRASCQLPCPAFHYASVQQVFFLGEEEKEVCKKAARKGKKAGEFLSFLFLICV